MNTIDPPILPGAFLLNSIIKPLGLQIPKLAESLQIPPNRLYLIINGKRDISIDTAVRLGKHFDTGPELWLQLQMQHDLYIYQKDRETIEQQVAKFSQKKKELVSTP